MAAPLFCLPYGAYLHKLANGERARRVRHSSVYRPVLEVSRSLLLMFCWLELVMWLRVCSMPKKRRSRLEEQRANQEVTGLGLILGVWLRVPTFDPSAI